MKSEEWLWVCPETVRRLPDFQKSHRSVQGMEMCGLEGDAPVNGSSLPWGQTGHFIADHEAATTGGCESTLYNVLENVY